LSVKKTNVRGGKVEIKLTAAQVAEIVDSDERVKQAVVSLYLQRNIPSLTISDLLVGQQKMESAGSAIGSLTTQQMMDVCIADNAVAAGHDTYSTESSEPEIVEEAVPCHGKGRLKR